MPRKARKFIRGPFYHVMCQGIKKETIFVEDNDFKKYLYLLQKYKSQFKIEILAYCIMKNHVHLLIYCDSIEQLSKFMHKINLIYAMNYNKLYERVGYVFRDRFKLEEITDIKYLYSCILYIHNNPVKAEICKFPNQYKYSSYSEYLTSPQIIDIDILIKVLGEKNYKELVLDKNTNNGIFLDIENNFEKLAKELITNFENRKRKKIDELLMNFKERRELLIELHVKNKISYRCIEKILNIDRRRLSNYVYGKKK